MQIYANVAGDPTWTPAKTEGLKGCWQFRAGEAFKEKNGQQQESTWYTVKDYSTSEHEAPTYGKGDFVKILGRLKAASWMNRAGKPEATLYVHSFDISVERKVGQKTVVKAESVQLATEPTALVVAPECPATTLVITSEPIEVAQETKGAKLISAVKGLFHGSVDDAPDWRLV